MERTSWKTGICLARPRLDGFALQRRAMPLGEQHRWALAPLQVLVIIDGHPHIIPPEVAQGGAMYRSIGRKGSAWSAAKSKWPIAHPVPAMEDSVGKNPRGQKHVSDNPRSSSTTDGLPCLPTLNGCLILKLEAIR